MHGERAEDRTVLAITGADRIKFLQDLITNDIEAAKGGLVYAALLSPQGKYLFDFFLYQQGDTVFLDVKSTRAAALAGRLMLYRLRADVQIETSELTVLRGVEPLPEGAMPDPRHAALGWRFYGVEAGEKSVIDWDALRVEHLIPEAEIELIENESYILEMGFERLNGVDFRKGCYVGQEVTARMKHKTELRKGLGRVSIDGEVVPGAEIARDGKSVGRLHTVSGGHGIAYLRFDQARDAMDAGDAQLRWSVEAV